MSDECVISNICHYMKNILENYNKIRGKNIEFALDPFWNAVIISASDAIQKMSYQMQIEQKQLRGELPLNVPFHVFNDPPGFKIGCGGSTMYVLEKVQEIYGNAMYDMRFLLIHAGGYSQRLPNLSVLGKLFCPLPFGYDSYQMLDLILATYLPFLKHMKPGVFLSSSDAIISFYLDDKASWTFENEGFTALAHPSTILIGTQHGVYVLPPNVGVGNSCCFMSDCLRVLQKPTIEEMYDKGAIIKNDLGGGEIEDVVFSDSAFFFDHEIVKKFISFFKNSKPLKCELSSYGDFLQPLGLSSSPSYIVDKITSEDLASLRSALYQNLYGTKLSLLVLRNSNFHHLGTMKEYVASLCFMNKFSDIFPSCRFSFSLYSFDSMIPLYVEGTVIHSIVHPLSNVPESSVLEYCDLNIAIDVGSNCIISNAQFDGFSVQRLSIKIPDNTLLHTVPLKEGYVSVAFGIHDDIKKIKSEDILDIQFFGKKLKTFVNSNDKMFDADCDQFSLWTAKLFPVCSTAEESLKMMLEIILYLNDGEMSYHHFSATKNVVKWVSMQDVLSLKDIKKMVNYQKELYEKILSGRKHN